MTPKQAKHLSLHVLGTRQRVLTAIKDMMMAAAEQHIFQPITPATVRLMSLSMSVTLNSFAPDGVTVDETPDYLDATVEDEITNRVTFLAKSDAPAWVLDVMRKFNA